MSLYVIRAAAEPGEPSPWPVIAAVGGLCWMVVGITAVIWLRPTSGVTSGSIYFISSGARLLQHFLLFVVSAPCYRLALALGWPKPVLARLGTVLVNALLALVICALSTVILAMVSGLVDHHYEEMHNTLAMWMPIELSSAVWAVPLRFFLPPYILGLCAVALVVAVQRQHRHSLRTAELASAYAEARLAALSAQLQPHFLFNALHGISELLVENSAQAGIMVTRLGDYLRHALDSSRRTWVELRTELDGLDAYLRVQQARFSDRLSVAVQADDDAREVFVPSLLLQPLAENAIEHGSAAAPGEPLQVRVSARIAAGRLQVAVRNSTRSLAVPLDEQRFGQGLQNVQLRMRVAYGEDATLSIAPDGYGGVSAALDLPLRGAGGSSLPVLQ